MSWKESILLQLKNHLDKKVELISTTPVGGGDINDAYHFETSEGSFFIKKNSSSRFPQMFEKEAKGLKLLADANELPVPEVVGTQIRCVFLPRNRPDPK